MNSRCTLSLSPKLPKIATHTFCTQDAVNSRCTLSMSLHPPSLQNAPLLPPTPPPPPPPPPPPAQKKQAEPCQLHQTFADSCCDWQQAYTQAKDCLVCLASTQTKLSSSPIPDPLQASKKKEKEAVTDYSPPPPPPPPSLVFSFWLLKGWDLHSSILQQQIIQCISNDKSNAKRKNHRKNTHKTIQPSNQMTSA